MKNLFKELTQKGFAIFPPIDVATQMDLVQFATVEFGSSRDPFHTTHFISNIATKERVHNLIKEKLTNFVTHFFPHYDLILGNFMIKNSSEDSAVPLHSDWSYIDESKYSSYSIWIPLCDLNEDNGGFGVVPFSHKIVPEKRGPNIDVTLGRSNEEIIENYGKQLKLKSGEILVYNHKLLHFSGVNRSLNTRVAINVSIVPKSCSGKLHHYYYIKELDNTRKYIFCDTQFYLNCMYGNVPPGNNFENTSNFNKYIDTKLTQLKLYKKIDDFRRFFDNKL